MPPKPSAKRTKSTLERDEQVEYALQAVVLCDVDSDKFSPLSRDLNPILFPIAGTRILAYTLEFLERGGVEDIILICSRQTAQLQAYLASTKWGERGSPVKIRLVTAAAAHSTGDALREVDRLRLVKGDFVLIRGGILSNLPLQFMVEEHRRRKEDDKDSLLMTIVLMQSDTHTAFSTKRHMREARLHVLDESNATASRDYNFHRCLVSEHIDVHPDSPQFVQLSKEITSHHTDVIFRNDLYDCNIEICSPEVPALFTENFDYEDLRRDFLNGVLTSDLMSKNIYCYIPKSGFGGNISSFEDYWRVNVDMAKGLTAPFDPSLNIEGDNNFSKKGSVWRDRDVKVGKAVQLQNVVIGKGSVIADGVSIENSIIGRNCQISGGVIADSVLWDNITLNSGCEVRKSVILSDNDVLKDVHLGSRAIILPHTQLPEATKIPDSARFTVYTATGQPLVLSDDDDDADEDKEEIPIDILNLSDSDISEIGSDSDADSDTPSTRRRRRSSASGFSDAPSTNQEFYTEAEESLSRAFLENHSVENAMIELKTLRMATNVTFHEVREAIISSLMNVYLTTPGIAAKLFRKWGGLLRKFEEDLEAELDSVMIMQRYFSKRLRENAQNPAERNKFVLGLQGMYNSDVFTEKTIFRWFADDRAKGVGEKGSEDMLSLRNASQKLITWLEEADEDSSEEEESDEE